MLAKANSFFEYDDTKSSTVKSSVGSKDEITALVKQENRSSSFTKLPFNRRPIEQAKTVLKGEKEASKSLDVQHRKRETILGKKRRKARLNYILKANVAVSKDIDQKIVHAPHRTNRLVSYFSPYSKQIPLQPKVSFDFIPKRDNSGQDETESTYSPPPSFNTRPFIPNDMSNGEDNSFAAFFFAKSFSRDYYKSNNHYMSNLSQMDSFNMLSSRAHSDCNYISDSNSDEILSLINSCTMDQTSCRFFQSKIHNNPHFANNVFFPAIKSNLIEMILNQFGNYLIQNTIEILSLPNLIEFLKLITPNFIQIAYSPHGTRVIQKYLEYIHSSDDLLISFNLLLKGNIAAFSNNENANHIIQKYVSIVKYPANSFIYENIYYNLFNIAITKHGCCVVQKCILFGTKAQKDTIVLLIIKNTYQLIVNQFGNYVYQFIIQMNNPVFNKEISKMIIPNLFVLCKHKYASNAVEKCLLLKNAEMPQMIMFELIKSEELFIDLLLDDYGNYVIQTALKMGKTQFFYKAIQIIANYNEHIVKIPFGFKLMKKLLSFYPELGAMINQLKQFNQHPYGNMTYRQGYESVGPLVNNNYKW